jgi:hypothetical protein
VEAPTAEAETRRAEPEGEGVEAPLALDVDAALARALDQALAEERWDAIDRVSARLDARAATRAEAERIERIGFVERSREVVPRTDPSYIAVQK